MAYEAGGTPVVGGAETLEVFADEALGFSIHSGVIRISFASVRPAEPVPPSPLQYVQVGRLVMPVDGAVRLSVALHNFLVANGIDPSAEVTGGAAVQ